jgi:beta-lactamase regulating signal transducer with metallopeptidase domain
MNEVLSFLTAWLVDLLVLGTALLAIACLALYFMRQPATRMALARGTLLGLAVLCVLTALPGWPRQPLTEVFSKRTSEENVADVMAPLPRMETSRLSPLVVEAPLSQEDLLPAVAPPIQTFSIAQLLKFLPLFWLGAAGCAIAYIFLGAWRAFRLLRSAVKAPDWSLQELERLVSPKNRAPRLKTSERIATAVALVAWKPHILLATISVTEENKVAVRAALAHEWAHIRHGDLWLLALERLLLPVFWLHPLFWLLRRQVRIDQELLADAAAAGDAPVEYAQALLSWAQAESGVAAPRWGVAVLPLWDHPSNLSRRVEMLLHPPSSVTAGVSRYWKWLAPLSLLAAVLGLSLVTLRPAAVAQDDAITDIEVQPRPDKIKKAKKLKPKKGEVSHDDVAPNKSPQPVPSNDVQVFLELLVGQVEHAALEKAEYSLGDLIQDASEDHCRLEGELIIAELSSTQLSTLTGELEKANAMKILSRPSLATLVGQEATLQIGSQVPLVRLEETVNGDSRRRVEYKEVGEILRIRPQLSNKHSLRLTLDIAAEHTEFDKRAELTTGDDTPRFITSSFRLTTKNTLDKTVVIAERKPKKGSQRGHSLLIAITPKKVAAVVTRGESRSEPRIEPAPPVPVDDTLRLRDENAVLRKQVDELQAKLVDLEVQVRWLRAAAVPGSEDKVSDEDFLRRVYLDLTGILPTAEETKSFLNGKDPQKRNKLIDQLQEENAKEEATRDWKRWIDASDNGANARSAAIKPALPEVPTDKEASDSIQIFRLTYTRSEAADEVITKILSEAEVLAVTVDGRTDSLILRGSLETQRKAKALLEALDREVDPKADAEKSAPPEKGASLRESKDEDMDKLKVTVSLRELELQEAETALLSAETALASSKELSAKGTLPSVELDRARVAVFERMIAVKSARLNLENAKSAAESKP